MPRSPEMLPAGTQHDASQKKNDEKNWGTEKPRRIARAGMMAIALHAPLVPLLGEKVLSHVKDHSFQERFDQRWSASGSVLRPQSEGEREKVEEQNRARAERADPDAARLFKQQLAERLEHGEPVTYRELYFQQERLSGVEPERVAQAERAANEMISYYASQLEQGLDDGFIRRMAKELYDKAAYDWGQGSVTGYFVDHKRNCVSYSQAEQIVFEGVIARLPEAEQTRYALGIRKESQHQITTLSVAPQMQAPSERLYILQPPFLTERIGESPAGVADVPEKILKEALTGKKVVIKVAGVKRGEQRIERGPKIDILTNQPVDDGIVIEGDLRDADANRREAKRQGLAPMTEREYEERFGEIELQIIEDIGGPTPENARARVKPPIDYRPVNIDAMDFNHPQKESVRAMNIGPDAPYGPGIIKFGKINQWSEGAIETLVQLRADTLSVELSEDGTLPKFFVESLQQFAGEKTKYGSQILLWNVLELRSHAEFIDESLLSGILGAFKHHRETLDDRDIRFKFKALGLSEFMIRRPEILDILSNNLPDALYITDFSGEVDTLKSFAKELPIPLYVQFLDLALQEAQFAGTERNFTKILEDDHQIYPDVFSILSSAAASENLTDVLQWTQSAKTYKAKIVELFITRLIRNEEIKRRQEKQQIHTNDHVSLEADQADWRWITSVPIDQLKTKSPEEWLSMINR